MSKYYRIDGSKVSCQLTELLQRGEEEERDGDPGQHLGRRGREGRRGGEEEDGVCCGPPLPLPLVLLATAMSYYYYYVVLLWTVQREEETGEIL